MSKRSFSQVYGRLSVSKSVLIGECMNIIKFKGKAPLGDRILRSLSKSMFVNFSVAVAMGGCASSVRRVSSPSLDEISSAPHESKGVTKGPGPAEHPLSPSKDETRIDELERLFRQNQPAYTVVGDRVVVLRQSTGNVSTVCGDKLKQLKERWNRALSYLFPETPGCHESIDDTIVCYVQGVTSNRSVVFVAFVFSASNVKTHNLALGVVDGIGIVPEDAAESMGSISRLFSRIRDSAHECE